MCPNIHLFVAYAAHVEKKSLKNPIPFAYLVRNLSSLIFSRVFLHTNRVGQKVAMRPQPQVVPNARPRDESMHLVSRVSRYSHSGS